jgi:anti-sigma B factor antagonist
MVLNISKQRIEPDILVVKLAGRLTFGADSQELEWQLKELVEKGEKKIVLDLSGLVYMDSTGLGIVATCSGKLRAARGELLLAGVTGSVKQLFHITGVERILKSCPTTAEAAEGFARTEIA